MQSLYKQLLPLTLIREICYLGSDHTFNFFIMKIHLILLTFVMSLIEFLLFYFVDMEFQNLRERKTEKLDWANLLGSLIKFINKLELDHYIWAGLII